MKQVMKYFLIFAIFSFTIGCATQTQDPQKMLAAAKALDQQFVDAYNSGDVDAIMDTYWNSPDLISFPADTMEIQGWEANKEALTKTFAEQAGGKLELIESNNTVVGDAVIGTGKWRFTMPMPVGEPMVVEGRYTDVKTERNGKWVYIIDHASVPLPPLSQSSEM